MNEPDPWLEEIRRGIRDYVRTRCKNHEEEMAVDAYGSCVNLSEYFKEYGISAGDIANICPKWDQPITVQQVCDSFINDAVAFAHDANHPARPKGNGKRNRGSSR